MYGKDGRGCVDCASATFNLGRDCSPPGGFRSHLGQTMSMASTSGNKQALSAAPGAPHTAQMVVLVPEGGMVPA
ncbi:hypothetical protein ACIG54_33395 [Streptomyces achromogenes]|uniref:hypothetical protein n=1 Tax=Streptomyces achromogenes TaxID=67255 RepID=UPI0037D76CA9